MTVRIGNTKLSLANVNKVLAEKITSTEIDLLLYIGLRQDPFGNVDGLYYKDICLELCFSKQTFYNAMYGLQKKGFLLIKNSLKTDYFNVRLENNVFFVANDDKEGYINLNRKFLHTWEFRNLKANEKKLCLKLLCSYIPEKGLDIYPSTIAQWLGIKSKSNALIYSYLENIKCFFPNIRVAGKKGDLVRILKGAYSINVCTGKTERELFLTHKIKHICRLYNISYTLKDLRDLIVLMAQYAKKGIGLINSVICNVLTVKKSIEPKLINKMFSMLSNVGQVVEPATNTQSEPELLTTAAKSFSSCTIPSAG